MQRHVNVDDVWMSAPPAQQPDRTSGDIVQRWDFNSGIGKESGDASLPRSTTPGLRHHASRDGDDNVVVQRTPQQGPNSSVTTFERKQRSGAERQSEAHVRPSALSAQA